jgi:hypothetical protein
MPISGIVVAAPATTRVRHIDTLGALAIALLAWREGREAFEKARGGRCSCEGVC